MSTPSTPSSPLPPLFHRPGLCYFWVLNDACDLAALDTQLKAFAERGVSAICPHPRHGLRLPYGGQDWYDFIDAVAERCAVLGIELWLYDEDPFPSGAAGGLVFAGHPEFAATEVQRFEYAPDEDKGEGVFTFPMGELLWCGVLGPDDSVRRDCTARVGVLRRQWQVWEKWDSRYFYPETPRYSAPRAETYVPEYGLTPPPPLAADERLVAFVARPTTMETYWGMAADTLNPACTRHWLSLTHERYKARSSRHFGKTITAIFTDEPKFMAGRPWTRDLAAAFEYEQGYDPRPLLAHLFHDRRDPVAMKFRHDYRDWCRRRFEAAWLQPVSAWCRQAGLKLVGHISPEDDPIQQAEYLGNLMPLQRHLDLCGLDLIIPAVGDARHPILNVGVTAAVSVAQQRGKPGVLSESLAASGEDMTVARAARILRWQTLMGVTSPVVHCAYSSMRGPRGFDYPPSYGPASPLWPEMAILGRELARWQGYIRGARQVAPVAILWPIRSFAARNLDWLKDSSGMRNSLISLLLACLEQQVGTQLLDEADLWDAKLLDDGQLSLGLARYGTVLIPSVEVLHERTVATLRAASQAGLRVALTGDGPHWLAGEGPWQSAALPAWPRQAAADAVGALPRLLALPTGLADLRVSVWSDASGTRALLINLGENPLSFSLAGQALTIAPAELQAWELTADGSLLARLP